MDCTDLILFEAALWEIRETLGMFWICGMGVSGGHLSSQKLCRTILLHFELITIEMDFWKTRKRFNLMVFGPSVRDHDSRNQLFLVWETPRYIKKSENESQIIWQITIWEVTRFGKSKLLNCLEKVGSIIPKIRLTSSWKSQMRDQYLPMNMK